VNSRDMKWGVGRVTQGGSSRNFCSAGVRIWPEAEANGHRPRRPVSGEHLPCIPPVGTAALGPLLPLTVRRTNRFPRHNRKKHRRNEEAEGRPLSSILRRYKVCRNAAKSPICAAVRPMLKRRL
jgi:hypothetical protein